MTTGRINQVAILLDVERRPPFTGGAGARPSCGRSFLIKGPGGASPLLHGMHWVRERSAPAWTKGTDDGPMEHAGRFDVLRRPREGAGWRAPFFMRIAPTERVGSTSAPRRGTAKATLGNTASEGIGRRQFDGPAQSQPTGTIRAPLIRPNAAMDQHHLSNHTPLSRGSSEQMEVTGGADPTVLGMKSVKRRCSRWTARTTARGIPNVLDAPKPKKATSEGNRDRGSRLGRGEHEGSPTHGRGNERESSSRKDGGAHQPRGTVRPRAKNPPTPKPY